jgi:serine/threonine-protein kinase
MLSGRQAFSGETASEILAAVLKTEPEWSVLPASAPARVSRILRRCLEKDLRRRVQAIGEARIAIEDALAGAPDETVAVLPGAALWRRALPWSLGVALLAFLLGLWAPWRPVPQAEKPQRLSVELGADASLVTEFGTAAVLSPDGSVLAFRARTAAGEASQLYVRRLDQLEAAPLAGTEGARNPFFSPDGEWIAFFASGKLKKVAITGGAAVTLCEAPDDRGGTWSEDGSILFTPGAQTGLWRVSSAGGAAEALATPDQAAGETSYGWPQALPGGESVLFTARRAAANLEAGNRVANLVVQRLPGGPRKIVHRGGYYGRYLPSGHLVYMVEGTLFAAPFDLDRLETTGPPAPVLEGVVSANGAQFAFSSRGTLVFVPGVSGVAAVPIQWMDAQGNLTPLLAAAADYRTFRLSPDGRRLAITIVQGQRDVWVYEWERDTLSRLTFDASDDYDPVWTPNGQRIAFASTRADKVMLNLYWQRADGTGEAERLTESPNSQYPTSWHPSGKFLAFWEVHPQTQFDIMILPLEGDEVSGWKPGKPSVFLNTPFNEGLAAFSPDGRFLAYNSNESGTYEVYVRPFPGPGGKWQVSTGGGESPVWSRNGKELFYWAAERIWVASYAAQGDSFRAEKPRAWSPGRIPWRAGSARFDAHPDGKRFAVVAAAEETEVRRDKVVLITNFFDELRRIAPPAKR